MSSDLHAEPRPFAYGMAPDWRRFSFDWQAGRPAVVILVSGPAPAWFGPLVDSFAGRAALLAECRANVLILTTPDQAPGLRAQMNAPPCIEVIPCDAGFLASNGATPGQPRLVVVDRNLRVALECDPADPASAQDQCLDCLRGLLQDMPAPVLILPNVLPRPLCRALIERFESGQSIEGTVAGLDAEGRPRSFVNHAVKRRWDLQLRPQDPLHPVICRALLERCAPEIAKATNVQVGYTDRLMLARYDSPAGWFRRHRDNTSENVAFREFAISVNLNTDEYEGGQLSFPEYSDRCYGQPTGAGLIFSASILHEVSPVSAGTRYVLLTFLQSEAGEARRRAYAARAHQATSPA